MPADIFPDNFIFFRPKSIVSGDFYWYKSLHNGGNDCYIIVAADCTGHGVPGGFMSMLGIAFINEIVQKPGITNAAHILDLLREYIKTALKQTGKQNEQKDGMDIAICLYYKELKMIEYAGAKNPLYKVRSNGELEVFKADRMPIGIYPEEKPFTNQKISIEKNDMIYMFSDGMTDQLGGLKGFKFMPTRLRELCVKIHKEPCLTQKNEIQIALEEWLKKPNGGEYEQTDDMLMIGFRC